MAALATATKEGVDMVSESVHQQYDKNGFPTDFQKGIAISTWQCSGSMEGQWDYWIKKPYFKILSRVTGGSPIEDSCDFWNRYKEDIDRAKKFGSNAFRLSFEWSKIEPKQGQIDHDAIKRYGEIIDYLIELKMEPNATLHHYVHPQWFETMGAFEKEDNIPHFVSYVKLIYQEFGSRIRIWATFNETQIFLILGHIIGIHPPGNWFHFHLMGQCTRNMLLAHCRAYKQIKSLEGGEKSRVGIVHNSQRIIPNTESFINRGLIKIVGTLCGFDSYVNFFKTGKLIWWSPIKGQYLLDTIPEAPECIDWWGLNYYSCIHCNYFGIPVLNKGQIQTDLGYPIYPQGISYFVKQISVLKVPIYITETGVADKQDKFRKDFIEQYLNEVFKNIKEGQDVRGFYYWSLVDNFEWSAGYSMKFGLYSFDMNTKVRTMREQSRILGQIYNTIPSNFDKLKDYLLKSNYSPSQEQ